MLEPAKAEGINHHIAFYFEDDSRIGLHVRNCVAVVTDGENADSIVHISWPNLAAVLAGDRDLETLVSNNAAEATATNEGVRRTLSCFELGGVRQR